MFIDLQSPEKAKHYQKLLQLVGSLSNIFSDSPIPFLHYRAAENIFCLAFGANNLSRSDIAIDAKKNDIGVGIKTFRAESKWQKIAEFNKERSNYSQYEDKNLELIYQIAQLRNKRLSFAANSCETPKLVYHCILRRPESFIIQEEVMYPIDLSYLRLLPKKGRGNSIHFKDNHHFYKFDLSKSTLYKCFESESRIEFPVIPLENPFECLMELFEDYSTIKPEKTTFSDTVVLPLYSTRYSNAKRVAPKSGLNQWNAGGRGRHPREVYIPIPRWIHEKFPDFFPDEGTSFNLFLPNGKSLSAKPCQADRKALMSSPNKDLGEWLLTRVLKLDEKQVVTYDLLQELGIDSVRITKHDSDNYSIDFAEIGSFDEFKEFYYK